MKNEKIWHNIRKYFQQNYRDLLVIILFLLFSLRVLNWFQYPNILCSGDLRPALVHDAFVKRAFYTWDETDFGLPSVYIPRLLDPYSFFTVFLRAFNIHLFFSQMLTLLLMYFLVSVLIYLYVKQLTNGDIIAAFVAALFFTSNIHLVIDREQTAIGFINVAIMIFPCLVTFTTGIKTRSYRLMVFSGLLFCLSYSGFPNYRATLLCIIALAITCLFLYIKNGLTFCYCRNKTSKLSVISLNLSLLSTYLKLIVVFIISLLLFSLWIITLLLTNMQTFLSTYQSMAAPSFVLYLRPYDVLRLIAKWSFYEQALGRPYIPYANVYTDNPYIVILTYFPTILAFLNLLFSRSKLTLYFSGIAMLFLLLTNAFNPYFNQLYFALTTYIPLMIAFRESSHWIFFVILSYGILIGITTSLIHRKIKHKVLQVLTIFLVALLFVSTSFQLVTGEVTQNWLNPYIRGTFFPHSYEEVNSILPHKHWTILFPKRAIYVVYNFSGIPFSCGNPYPLIFSKPFIWGGGTEYIQSRDSTLIEQIYNRAISDLRYINIASEGRVVASSNETQEFTPEKAIDGRLETRWSSQYGTPQWFEIEWDKPYRLVVAKIFFESAYADEYSINVWNGSTWTTVISIKNNTFTQVEHIFPQPINTTKLRIIFTKASPFGSVSIWEVEVYAETEVLPKFLGILGIKNIVLEKNIIYGNSTSPDELKHKLKECESFKLIREWDELELFENRYALEKIFAADNIINHADIEGMYETIEYLEWDILNHTVFTTSNVLNESLSGTLIMPENFVWYQLSPTNYIINTYSKGPFILVLLENYSQSWKLRVNGKLTSETDHFIVNSYANGWIVKETGNLTLNIYYETQETLKLSVIASIIAPIPLLIALTRKELNIPKVFE
ncbi:MAG: discoidin domain-containing protein [Nitrososphaeria archaeon]